jgi:adenosylcobinamide-GDP ribazoletransferase
VAATLIAALAAAALGGARGIIAIGLVWLAAHTLARWWVRDLGGLTGDTYGALCEIGEVIALAALTARI